MYWIYFACALPLTNVSAEFVHKDELQELCYLERIGGTLDPKLAPQAFRNTVPIFCMKTS